MFGPNKSAAISGTQLEHITDKKYKPPNLLKETRSETAIRDDLWIRKLLLAQDLLIYAVSGGALIFGVVCVSRIHRA